MNDNARKWVAALRSGEFKQGKSVLCNPMKDEYCCLGIAAELFAKEYPDSLNKRDDYDIRRYEYKDNEYIGVLPPVVKEWLGLAGETGTYYTTHEESSLSGDNDYGKTFAEIADIIESQPEGLFNE